MGFNDNYEFASIPDILQDARDGKMFILVDDENRENEGDLIVIADFATPEKINFMAKYGRGLICLALDHTVVDRLGLKLHKRINRQETDTAFTYSIEARKGVTTGISAFDRAKTIAVAIDEKSTLDDLKIPGHVFPLLANKKGVLGRNGHTEAAVDIAKMSGFTPAAVICEIMKDDGTMARRNDLIKFAAKHNLKIATINSLVKYRVENAI